MTRPLQEFSQFIQAPFFVTNHGPAGQVPGSVYIKIVFNEQPMRTFRDAVSCHGCHGNQSRKMNVSVVCKNTPNVSRYWLTNRTPDKNEKRSFS